MKSTPKITHRETVRDLALLFMVPLLIGVIVIALTYIPRFFAHPQYDFIYCQGYDCQSTYVLDDSKHITVKYSSNSPTDPDTALYYYSTARDSSRRLPDSEASHYTLDNSSKSPDGYTLAADSNGSAFLFWGSYSTRYVLKNGMKVKPTSIRDDYNNVNFVGWIDNEK